MLDVDVQVDRDAFQLRVAFHAQPGEVVALFGRSGCGKSSTVDLIAGLLRPARGRITLGGRTLFDADRHIDVAAERRGIGYVFQDARLFPHFDVRHNLEYGLRRTRGREIRLSFDGVVALLGLEPLLERRVRQLSGGERQRVAIGRALLSQPELMLLDEPLASLDQARRNEVLPWLERLRSQLRLPIIYVSHQYEEVLQLATRVVLMQDGAVCAQADPCTLSLDPRLRGIIGSELLGSVVEGSVVFVDARSGLASVAVGSGTLNVDAFGLAAGERVRIHLLARDLILALAPVQTISVRNQIAGTILAVEDDVDRCTLVRVDIGGPQLLARITAQATRELQLRAGLGVTVLVKAVTLRGHIFPEPALA